MNQSPSAWNRLVDTARGAPDARDTAAPYGFAVRVAALAFAGERPAGPVFARLALRAMGVSCLLAIAAVAANYSSVRRLFDDSSAAAAPAAASAAPDDPMTALVDLGTS
jgi:hypothetical protein